MAHPLLTRMSRKSQKEIQMHSNNIKLSKTKQVNFSFRERDRKLLRLQEHITDKISKTSDERLIKLYLRQVSQLATERSRLRKVVSYENN